LGQKKRVANRRVAKPPSHSRTIRYRLSYELREWMRLFSRVFVDYLGVLLHMALSV